MGPRARGAAAPRGGRKGGIPPPPVVPSPIVPPPVVPPPVVPPPAATKSKASAATLAVDEPDKFGAKIVRFLKTTIMLNENNYYIVRLRHTAWSAGWNPALLDLDQFHPAPWN